MKLSYDLVCPSVGGSIGRKARHNFLKGGKFHFHAPIGALVFSSSETRFKHVEEAEAAHKSYKEENFHPLGKVSLIVFFSKSLRCAVSL